MGELNYIELGRRIRTARSEQKLTQEEAAEKCDVTTSYYGNVERGDKKMSVETLAKISMGLGISADKLIFGETSEELGELADFLMEIQRNVNQKQFKKYLTIIKTLSTIADKL